VRERSAIQWIFRIRRATEAGGQSESAGKRIDSPFKIIVKLTKILNFRIRKLIHIG